MTDKFVFNDLGPAELSSDALENLQCNILSSTGRPKSTQIFRRFDTGLQLAEWLASQPTPPPATQNDQVPEVVNVLFSNAGLELLGVDTSVLVDKAFQRGARHGDTLGKLRDRKPDTWGDHERPWHVVELRAHDSPAISLPPTGSYVAEHGTGLDKEGNALSDRHQHSYGHFGILDGISKLVYTQADYNLLKQKPPAGRGWKFDPRQTLSTLLVPDPFAKSENRFGSYFVFRKYKQSRAEFEKRIDAIVENVEGRRLVHQDRGRISPDFLFPTLQSKKDAALREEIKRLIFGRDSDGNTAFATDKNDFDYRADPSGALCPFHSHTSKMNPRGRTGNLDLERSRAIARRGTSYVKTTVTTNGTPTTKAATGLLFWSAQASIENQFEYIMERWGNAANTDGDEHPSSDFDTVIGVADPVEPAPTIWRRWKDTTHLDCNIWKSVTLVGAEYLYAPSLEGFDNLKKLAAERAARGV